MKRHLGQPVKVKICDDEIRIPVLPLKYLPEFYFLLGEMDKQRPKLEGTNKEDVIDILSLGDIFGREVVESLTKLIKVSCEKSPDIGKPNSEDEEDEMDEFISVNLIPLMDGIFKVNMQSMMGEDKRKINKLRKKYAGTKRVSKDSE